MNKQTKNVKTYLTLAVLEGDEFSNVSCEFKTFRAKDDAEAIEKVKHININKRGAYFEKFSQLIDITDPDATRYVDGGELD